MNTYYSGRQSQATLIPATWRKLLSRSLIYAILIVLSIIFMAPFIWAVTSSLKDVSELYIIPPKWIPDKLMWSNYTQVLNRVPFGTWTRNSLLITGLSVLGAMLSASFVAFSFARFRYPGRDVIFLLTLSTMMLPVEVTIIPTYLLFNKIGWLDTLKPLIIPSWLGGGAFNIFLLRQFFMTIPLDLDEAAVIDGANPIYVFWSIILPLSGPVLATVAVIGFIGHWNEFMGPLIYLNSVEKYPLAVGLSYFRTSRYLDTGEPMEHLLMASSVMMLAPCIALFFVAQRYFVRGIVTSGIKG